MAASRCLERCLFLNTVLRCYCVSQVLVGRSHWNCYVNAVFWMFGFARNIVCFSGLRRFRCGAKLARVRDGVKRHRFAEVTFSLLCWRCAIVLSNSASADRSGMAASRCLERYLFSSIVLRLYFVFANHSWQIALELLQYMNDVLWMLRFARNIVLFWCKGKLYHVAEKSWLVSATGLQAWAASL